MLWDFDFDIQFSVDLKKKTEGSIDELGIIDGMDNEGIILGKYVGKIVCL